MKRIRRVLVANRGEIARRVMRTCRAMGIETVAIFSDADADALHVRDADCAARIGPPPSGESYLVIDRIVDAARSMGCDAIHPGYGFLAENAGFAQACADAEVIFIGPTADAIRAMGSKREAKRIVAEAGVAVIPGYDGASQDPDTLVAEAKKVGFPLLLKASAGGGGKGMRVVREASELPSSIESARREADSSFGDGTLLIEKYIDQPRHIEFQILGDAHGNLVHLFERECTIQRRHQKIVEETPSVALDDDLRARMGEAAVKVGSAIGYRNAGTVEMILGPDRQFYFLEVNTRLQVEHPVTELVTGFDLVREQIHVAQGEPLGFGQSDVRRNGSAVEVRIYAEDPANGFLPASGRIVDWHVPDLPGLRVDTGVETGSEVGIHYDPMLAKIIAHGPTRDEALQVLAHALRGTSIQGIRTNRAFLLHVLEHEVFRSGSFDTHFIDEHLGEALSEDPAAETIERAAIAATFAGHEIRRRSVALPHIPRGWRNNPSTDQIVDYEGPVGAVQVRYRHLGGGRFTIGVDDRSTDALLVGYDGTDLTWEDGAGVRRRARVISDGASWFVQSLDGSIALVEKPRFPDRSRETIPGACVAPMPGRIVALSVASGDHVDQGQVLMVMEAMKMEHSVTSPETGTVALHVAAGEQVESDQVLAVVESAEAEA